MSGPFFRCRRCLYPSTKPDLWFSDDGICSACLAYDARAKIDWAAKRKEFMDFVHSYAIGLPWRTHDCIVACSGGKDSTAQVVKCLELGLRPLAVTATTDHLSELGRKNLDNISRLCDHVEVTPNKIIRNKIARFALEEIGDISWCEHHLIWSIPAREAQARDIPIVLYGECPQNEYGAGPKGSEQQTRLTDEWVHEFGGLLGLRLDDLPDILGIPVRELEIYRRPEGVEAVFMGAYFPWDGYENAHIARQNGFTFYPNDVEGSLHGFENLDNLQTGAHDRLRFLKFGYSRACDIASSYIRRGGLRRNLAVAFVREQELKPFTSYLGVPLADILANIGMTESQYRAIEERFTNKPLVEWALSEESYSCWQPVSSPSYSGTTEAASRADSSTRGVALVALQTGFGSSNGGTLTS